jgi:hypothetical protein
MASISALHATCFKLVSSLAYSSTLKMERHIPPKCRLTFNGLYGVIPQTEEVFKLDWLVMWVSSEKLEIHAKLWMENIVGRD